MVKGNLLKEGEAMHITKMHGLGNDFIVIEEKTGDAKELAKKLCRRRLDVGADGLLLVEPSSVADIKMRIINADGSEAEMCGNGIRCFARYVHDRGIVRKKEMEVETLAGIIRPELVMENGEVSAVRVDMGIPTFDPERIPVRTKTPENFLIEADGQRFAAASVLMGVPHTVILVENLDCVPVERWGPLIETNGLFPRKTNVNFVEILDRSAARMETWERGAGRTLACGTGATSCGIVLFQKGLVEASVDLHVPAGVLHIENMPDGHAFMTGAADYVFRGETT